MRSPNRHTRGFTLVELAVVILLLGLLFGMGVPAIRGMSTGQQLKANTENVAAQLRMARQRAITIGSGQTMHFNYGYSSSDYHIHNGDFIPAKWSFSKGITYYSGNGTTIVMQPDGRASTSGTIILQDTRGLRDTVSIQVSGLVLTK